MWFLIIVGIVVFIYICYKSANRSNAPTSASDPLSQKLQNSPYYSKYSTAFQLIMHSNQKTEEKINMLLESLDMGYELEAEGAYVVQSIEENLPYYCETEEEYDRIKETNITSLPPMLFFPDKSKPPVYILEGMINIAFSYKMGSILRQHPSKYEYWKNKIIQMAEKGDLQAQAVLCSEQAYCKTLFTEEEHTRFCEMYYDKIVDVLDSNPEAALAVGKYFSEFVFDESKTLLSFAATKGNSSDAWYWLGILYDRRIGIDPSTGKVRTTPISNEEKADLLYNKTQCFLCGAQSETGVLKGFCQYYAAVMIEDEKPDMARYLYAQAHENGVH